MAGNLKEVRERIRSVQNTQQITKAMKMVSAAKFRKAQQAIVQMRPYADKLNAMLRNILSNVDGGDSSSAYGVQRPVERACVVVVTSNRGLAGAFNTNVIKAAVQLIDTKFAHLRGKGTLDIICIGKKGYDFFRRRYTDCNVIGEYVELFGDLSFDNVAKVSSRLMKAFEDKTYDAVYVAYGRFKNAATQFPEAEQFLPVAKLTVEDAGASKQRANYIFEPSEEGLLEYLIPSILQTQFHKFVLDTHASEHGARMTAMDKATENAEEMLRELRINYNKARQEAITGEILEIVGGAAALSGR